MKRFSLNSDDKLICIEQLTRKMLSNYSHCASKRITTLWFWSSIEIWKDFWWKIRKFPSTSSLVLVGKLHADWMRLPHRNWLTGKIEIRWLTWFSRFHDALISFTEISHSEIALSLMTRQLNCHPLLCARINMPMNILSTTARWFRFDILHQKFWRRQRTRQQPTCTHVVWPYGKFSTTLHFLSKASRARNFCKFFKTILLTMENFSKAEKCRVNYKRLWYDWNETNWVDLWVNSHTFFCR